jgi:hypothetical protein
MGIIAQEEFPAVESLFAKTVVTRRVMRTTFGR